MKEELIKLLREYLDEKYERAGKLTGTFGNWSENRQYVKENTSLEDFCNFLITNHKEI